MIFSASGCGDAIPLFMQYNACDFPNISYVINRFSRDEMGFAKEVADRVLFVDGGLILEDGSPSQVFDAPTSDRTKLFLSKIL